MPNIQTNMPSIHSNVPSIHSNVPSVHSNMPSVHSNMPNIHDVAARSNIPTCQTCTTSPLAPTFQHAKHSFQHAKHSFQHAKHSFQHAKHSYTTSPLGRRCLVVSWSLFVQVSGPRNQSHRPSAAQMTAKDTPQRTNERTHERTNERTNERTERVSSSVARATCRPCLLTYFTWTTCFPSLSSIYPGCRNGCRGVCGRMVRADVRIILRERGCRDGRNVVE